MNTHGGQYSKRLRNVGARTNGDEGDLVKLWVAPAQTLIEQWQKTFLGLSLTQHDKITEIDLGEVAQLEECSRLGLSIIKGASNSMSERQSRKGSQGLVLSNNYCVGGVLPAQH